MDVNNAAHSNAIMLYYWEGVWLFW